MPIFISYSHQDASFVDTLVNNLIAAKHHVWMDRWELSLGDSLTQKIESALGEANAILVIISRNSVQSNWCKRELTAGLVRELEEKKTLVMPCVIDDCEIPLFLRDKLHADFRRDADAAFDLVDRSLAKLSNPLQGRLEQPDFHTDWAVDWREIEEGQMLLCWTFVDHGNDWPYTILSQCRVLCNRIASERFIRASKRGQRGTHLCGILECILDKADGSLSVRIQDQFEKFIAWKAKGSSGASYQVMYAYRRMGEDTGMHTLLHLGHPPN